MWGDFREKLKIETFSPAVNEKGEFAGNVQFVAGAKGVTCPLRKSHSFLQIPMYVGAGRL
jgi:hypothetical protein